MRRPQSKPRATEPLASKAFLKQLVCDANFTFKLSRTSDWRTAADVTTSRCMTDRPWAPGPLERSAPTAPRATSTPLPVTWQSSSGVTARWLAGASERTTPALSLTAQVSPPDSLVRYWRKCLLFWRTLRSSQFQCSAPKLYLLLCPFMMVGISRYPGVGALILLRIAYAFCAVFLLCSPATDRHSHYGRTTAQITAQHFLLYLSRQVCLLSPFLVGMVLHTVPPVTVRSGFYSCPQGASLHQETVI